jgi:uncharacterized membrane protein
MAGPSRRIQSIDLLRGWAVVFMIETHVLNATLLESLRNGAVFSVLTFMNGLVAPAFLFASGMAYAATARRKMKDYLSCGPALFRQVGRLLSILAIGYLLHVPRFNFHHLLYEVGAEAWVNFFQVDVLHCIAVTLLLLQVMLSVFRTEERTYRAAAVVAVLLALATPLVWSVDWATALPLPFATYLNSMHGSLFPLFPWSAFLLAGAVAGHLLNGARDRQTDLEAGDAMDRFRNLLGWCALVALLISFAMEPVAASLYPAYDYWKTSPSFVLFRLGLIMALTFSMFVFEKHRGVSSGSIVALFGRESLIVYVTHLMLLYGKFGSFCFAERVRGSFGYGEVLIACTALLLLMYALAFVWDRVKRGSPRIRYALEFTVLAVFLVVFFTDPLS